MQQSLMLQILYHILKNFLQCNTWTSSYALLQLMTKLQTKSLEHTENSTAMEKFQNSRQNQKHFIRFLELLVKFSQWEKFLVKGYHQCQFCDYCFKISFFQRSKVLIREEVFMQSFHQKLFPYRSRIWQIVKILSEPVISY